MAFLTAGCEFSWTNAETFSRFQQLLSARGSQISTYIPNMTDEESLKNLKKETKVGYYGEKLA